MRLYIYRRNFPQEAAVSSTASPAPGSDAGLDDFLCFAVYSANLAFGRAYKPVLDALGLASYTQYIAIVALSEADELSVGALGERLFLESNTLTPILKKLEALGYVRRRRDPADERQVLVSLTDVGRAAREKARALRFADATGLGDDFGKVQQAMTTTRDNLLRYVKATQG
jgi:DNA-binding MarR family transcriptional regulator